MCVTSNCFYAVIETSCLSYIFSILSFIDLYFISISEILDAKSSQCILVIILFYKFTLISLQTKDWASGRAEVETRRVLTQCWGQRLSLAFFQLPFETQELKS